MSLFIGKNSNTTSLIATPADENMLIYVILKYFAPKIGQLKFVARKNKHNIPGLEQDSDGVWKLKASDPTEFDGWVYLDGAKYSTSSFPKIANALGVPTMSDGFFIIPSFDDYFFSATSVQQQYSTIPQTNAVIDHQHHINSKSNAVAGKISNGFSAWVTRGCGSQGYMMDPAGSSTANVDGSTIGNFLYGHSLESYLPVFHNGVGGHADDPVFKTDLHVDVNSNFSSIKLMEYGSSSASIWPNCKTAAAMVYIGVYKGIQNDIY